VRRKIRVEKAAAAGIGAWNKFRASIKNSGSEWKRWSQTLRSLREAGSGKILTCRNSARVDLS